MNNGQINLEVQIDDISMASVVEDDGYLFLNFHDDMDDALSEVQTIKIHPVNFAKFADMIYETALLSMGKAL